MLQLDPAKRISINDALRHAFVQEKWRHHDIITHQRHWHLALHALFILLQLFGRYSANRGTASCMFGWALTNYFHMSERATRWHFRVVENRFTTRLNLGTVIMPYCLSLELNRVQEIYFRLHVDLCNVSWKVRISCLYLASCTIVVCMIMVVLSVSSSRVSAPVTRTRRPVLHLRPGSSTRHISIHRELRHE